MGPLQQVHCLRFAGFVPEIAAADMDVCVKLHAIHASASQVLIQAKLLRPAAVNRRFSRVTKGLTQLVMGFC